MKCAKLATPIAPALTELSFQMIQNKLNDPKGPENFYLHHDYVRGDVLRLPQGTTAAGVVLIN